MNRRELEKRYPALVDQIRAEARADALASRVRRLERTVSEQTRKPKTAAVRRAERIAENYVDDALAAGLTIAETRQHYEDQKTLAELAGILFGGR